MLVIIDYGVGNLGSILNMLNRIGIQAIISGKESDLASATKIILPGVGAFDHCIEKLEASGLKEVLQKKVTVDKTPIMGICLGMQMMMKSSEEGIKNGLGWIDGDVVKFDPSKLPAGLKIPHMSWSDVEITRPTKLMTEMYPDPRFYFVHSYYARLNHMEDEILSAVYGHRFTCGIEKENICGVQFHPEKSHKFGMKLLQNFANHF